MDFYTFFSLLHDAVVFNNLSSNGGVDYLNKCWQQAQTGADYAGLRRLQAKLGGGKNG